MAIFMQCSSGTECQLAADVRIQGEEADMIISIRKPQLRTL